MQRITLISLLSGLLVGCCSDTAAPPDWKPKFAIGEKVQHRADGRVGIVLGYKFWSDYWDRYLTTTEAQNLDKGYFIKVRFGTVTETPRTHFIAADESTIREPYAVVDCHPFELEKAPGE
jgi:hypothetical protein